jgi:hypothetical protein
MCHVPGVGAPPENCPPSAGWVLRRQGVKIQPALTPGGWRHVGRQIEHDQSDLHEAVFSSRPSRPLCTQDPGGSRGSMQSLYLQLSAHNYHGVRGCPRRRRRRHRQDSGPPQQEHGLRPGLIPRHRGGAVGFGFDPRASAPRQHVLGSLFRMSHGIRNNGGLRVTALKGPQMAVTTPPRATSRRDRDAPRCRVSLRSRIACRLRS